MAWFSLGLPYIIEYTKDKAVVHNIITYDYLKPFFDNVLLEHGGLPQVLPLAFHLFFLWLASRGGNSKSLLLFEYSC